ncbi:hypothetical protein PF010_g3623 [Phytophthora fragariae]|uniref:Uncharacterized protein n=1 Tax=Phytophthora fragariae TaxID=53985 RepID=A0A6A4A802_9STRA|nr:hypothetical protein PF010_g3623 [Phytophthora fragariae]KAE9251479.1 hypothetical protein PF002_g4274 [Phytophthora fragariae]
MSYSVWVPGGTIDVCCIIDDSLGLTECWNPPSLRDDDVVLDVERGTRRKLVLVLDLLLRKESPSPSMRLSATLGPYRRIESIMTPDRKLVRRW